MRHTNTIAVAAMLLFVLAIAGVAAEKMEIRGPVAEVVESRIYSWGPQDFAGFYYNINDDIGTETLILAIKDNALVENTRPRGIVYRTDAKPEDFEFDGWGYYYTIGFLGEPYFAGYAERTDDGGVGHLYEDSTDRNLLADELLSVVLINEDEERTIASGAPLGMEESYRLVINTIDLEGDKVFVELYKDDEKVDSKVVEPSKKGAGMEERTYTYKKSLDDAEDVVIIAVHFKNAFRGADQDLATVDGIWQISEKLIDVEEGAEYDKMTIQSIGSNAGNMFIEMDNEDEKIALSKNKDIGLMDDFRIKTADQEEITSNKPLRFYIYRGVTKPGTYEIRGEVAEVIDNTGTAPYLWDRSNFAGFFYDIDEDLGREKISMVITNDTLRDEISSSGRRGVVYETEAQRGRFEFEEWGEYWTIGFLGKEYFAAYVDSPGYFLKATSEDPNLVVDEQLSEVLYDDDEEMTFAAGMPLRLEEGYELVINQIDLEGDKVYVELYKDGEGVDSQVVEPSKEGAGIEEETYAYKKDLGDTEEIVLIAVHFKNAFRGADQDLATVNGIWQISDAPIDVEEDAEYDKMTIQTVDSGAPMRIVMDNEDNEITLNKNKDITLMGNIRIKIADQDEITSRNPLRFYIYESVTLNGKEVDRGTLKSEAEEAAIEEVSPAGSEPVVGEVVQEEVETVEEEISEVPSEENDNGLPGFGIAFATCSLAATYLVLRRRD